MSRLVKFMIVLLAIAVATPVLAEDRLSLDGQMRVRGWHTDIDGADNTNTWADQRLRIGGKISVAEGVSVTFRTDVTEARWGAHPGFGAGRFTSDSQSMQWDRAHLDLQKGMLHLRAGQQWVGFGKSGFDAQDNGLTLMTKGAVPVTVFFMVDDENDFGGNTTSTNPGNTDSDGYYYGFNVGHKTDMYAANVFAASQKNTVNEVYVVGLTYAQNLDVLNLYTELEYFFGDHTAAQDAYGLQAFVDVSAAVAETVTVGGQFFYAMGDDDDFQYTRLGNGFNGWDPVFSLGTGLDNEEIKYGGGNPYAALGNGAGLYAGRIYASMKATDDLSFSGSAFFGVDDEKKRATYKNVMAFGAGMSYAVMANTKLGVQLQYSDYSTNRSAVDDLKKFEVGTGLFVNF